MNATYKLVEMVKVKTGIESDYGIAKAYGFTKAMVSNWKTERAEASAVNTLKLMQAAGLSIDDALKLMTQPPVKPSNSDNHNVDKLYIM